MSGWPAALPEEDSERCCLKSLFHKRACDGIQGNKLSITAVNPESRLSKPNDIGSCLANQERLGTGGLGTDYGIIAIQRFTTKTEAQLLTCHHPEQTGIWTPLFGWAQNVDLMSSDAGQRAKADSARYVMAAMKRAGTYSLLTL